MKPITYITNCGCHVSAAGTIRKKGYSRVCREHGEIVIRAERECIDCGCVIILRNTGKGPFRCEKHRLEHYKKKRHEVYLKSFLEKKDCKPRVKPKSSKTWKTDFRGDYCRWLKTCIAKKDLKCAKCIKFVGIFRGVDPGRIGIGA